MNNSRGYWFNLFGLILGIGIGILVAWAMPQAQPTETSPASLRADFKDEYRYMIAAAYAISGDLGRAQARLATLEDPDLVTVLKEQAQRLLAQNAPMDKIRVLANLSEALQAQPAGGQSSPTPEIPLPASEPAEAASPAETDTPDPAAISSAAENPSAPPTPIFTATPRPPRTATPTQGAPFALTNQTTSCETQQPGLLQIELKDKTGKPAPGVELIVAWFGGEEHFFTGLKNEVSPGYADFIMTTGIEYALSLSGGSTRITGLIAPACTDSQGNAYPGLIRLEFQQP